MDFFTDEHRHPFFHTNNLWWDLEQLDAILKERDGVMGLPLIRNEKTVDPSDKSSTPPVFQIEAAMGGRRSRCSTAPPPSSSAATASSR